jgi:hypothetical protein
MKVTVSSTTLQKMKSWQEEMKTCIVEVQAMDLGANPEEKETVVERQKVPTEEATVKTIRALKMQHGDWHLATEQH